MARRSTATHAPATTLVGQKVMQYVESLNSEASDHLSEYYDLLEENETDAREHLQDYYTLRGEADDVLGEWTTGRWSDLVDRGILSASDLRALGGQRSNPRRR